LERRLGGPQSRSGRGGEEKDSQPLPGLEPPIVQPVAQRCATELSRLLTSYLMFLKSPLVCSSETVVFLARVIDMTVSSAVLKSELAKI
jgi:hypothetical protein